MRPLLALALLAPLALSACDPPTTPPRPWFSQLTSPPPSKQAQLRTSDDGRSGTITLSLGVAMAFHCSLKGEPCLSITPADGAALGAFPALGWSPYSRQDAGVFVVAGSKPGRTQLTVRFAEDTSTFDVEVVP